MKSKLGILTLLLVFSIVVAGCSNPVSEVKGELEKLENEPLIGENKFEGDFFSDGNFNRVYIITDKNTSCKYIIASQFQAGYGTSITPLLKADGTPDCEQ